MDEVLDLSILLAKPRKIKIGDRILEIPPLKLRQSVELRLLFTKLDEDKESTAFQKEQLVVSLLEDIVPGMKTDKSIDFSYAQMIQLFAFLLQTSDELNEPDANGTKKKSDSVEPSPIS